MTASSSRQLEDLGDAICDAICDERPAYQRGPLGKRHLLEALRSVSRAEGSEETISEGFADRPEDLRVEGAHAATDHDDDEGYAFEAAARDEDLERIVPGTLRVEAGLAAAVEASSGAGLQVDEETVEILKEKLGPLDPLEVQVLEQLTASRAAGVADEDCVSKAGRDGLIRRGFAARSLTGLTYVTIGGAERAALVYEARAVAGARCADQELLAQARLAAQGRAHDEQVMPAELTKVCGWRVSPDCTRHISGPPEGELATLSHGICPACFVVESKRLGDVAAARPA